MSTDLVAPLVALTKHNIAPDIQGLLVYGNPLRDVPPGALEAAIAAAQSERVKQLEEALRAARVSLQTEKDNREALATLLAKAKSRASVAEIMLSEGLALCSRARRMEELEEVVAPGVTRSATIPSWAEEQYQNDLASWEMKARALLNGGSNEQG